MKCNDWFLGQAGLLFRKIRPLPHLALSVHKSCDARRFYRRIITERFSVVRKFLFETMIEEIEMIVLKKLDLLNGTIHTILTISAYRFPLQRVE